MAANGLCLGSALLDPGSASGRRQSRDSSLHNEQKHVVLIGIEITSHQGGYRHERPVEMWPDRQVPVKMVAENCKSTKLQAIVT